MQAKVAGGGGRQSQSGQYGACRGGQKTSCQASKQLTVPTLPAHELTMMAGPAGMQRGGGCAPLSRVAGRQRQGWRRLAAAAAVCGRAWAPSCSMLTAVLTLHASVARANSTWAKPICDALLTLGGAHNHGAAAGTRQARRGAGGQGRRRPDGTAEGSHSSANWRRMEPWQGIDRYMHGAPEL